MSYSELPYNGNYPPGVTDNDPYFTDETEPEDEMKPCIHCDEPTDRERDDGTPVCEDCKPAPVPCSYPGCTRLTSRDPVYGDLCYEHCRAENE